MAYPMFAILLFLAATTPLAASESSNTDHRSSIEWLIDDLGGVLKKIAAAVDTNSAQENEEDNTAPPVVSVAIDPSPEQQHVDDPTKPRGLVNPFTAMFADLVSLLTPQEKTTFSAEPEDRTASISAEAPSQAMGKSPASDLGSDAIPSNSVSESPTSKHSNPISWLLSDLASLISPRDTTITAVKNDVDGDRTAADPNISDLPAKSEFTAGVKVASSPAPGHAAPAAESANPFLMLFTALADVFQPAIESDAISASDASHTATPSEEAAIQMAVPVEEKLSTDDASLEKDDTVVFEGPWTQTAGRDPFDPSTIVVTSEVRVSEPSDVTDTDVISRIPSKAGDKVASSNNTPGPSLIRKRSEPVHEARNHRSLGAVHRQRDETPREESLIANFVDAMFGEENGTETVGNKVSDRIVAEERLDLGYVKHDRSPSLPVPEKTLIGESILTEIDLFMGKDTAIGSPYDPDRYGAQSCLDRPLHASVFCLTPLDWPAAISSSFEQDTAFFKAGEAVARYENGRLSRVYTVFNAADFADVVKFMQRQFGAPMEREIIWMHIMEAPELPNTTFRWKAVTADRRDVIVLEVRNYDDMRRSFANTEHGMIRLYREGSRPIFKHLTTMDLMLMQRRRISRAPIVVNAPPPQR